MRLRKFDTKTNEVVIFGNGGAYASSADSVPLRVYANVALQYGELFYNTEIGIDWLNIKALRNSADTAQKTVERTVLNTVGVHKVNKVVAQLNRDTRQIHISLNYNTIFGVDYQNEVNK